MRYMVIMHNGTHEDQDVAGIVVMLDSKERLKPQQILEKWVKDFTAAYSEEFVPQGERKCINDKCPCYKVKVGGGPAILFCGGCGRELQVIPEEVQPTNVLRYMINEFFFTQSHSLSQVIIEELEEQGWEMFPEKYRPDFIVWLTGVNLFMEDKASWEHCLGEMTRSEVIRANPLRK